MLATPLHPLHLDLAHLDLALTPDEEQQARRIVERYSCATGRRHTLDHLVTELPDGSIRVTATVKLVDAEIEVALRSRVADLHDHVLLGRHCAAAARSGYSELVESWTLATARLEQTQVAVAVRLGVMPTAGPDWSLTDVPKPLQRAARELASSLARSARQMVRHASIAELFVVEKPSGDHVIRVADSDAATRRRAEVFVDELRRLADMHDHLVARVRFEAQRGRPDARERTFERRAQRRRDARDAIDLVGCLHAAIRDVEESISDAW